jgi:K+-sensing histidine kinase KdpD
VTAFPDEFRAGEGYASGAVDYLSSPVVPEVLRAKVRVFVRLFEMTAEVKRQSEERLALEQERMQRAAAEEASRRLAFLAEATAALGRSLDYQVIARELVRRCIPALGDCAVVTRCDSGGKWQIVQARAFGQQVSIEELADLDGIPLHLAEAIRRLPADERAGSSAKPEARREEDLQSIVVPLGDQTSLCAVFGISREVSREPFSPADFALAEALASRAAMAFENAQLYKGLEQADRQKDEFLSMLAHELRNPLAPIRTAVDLLNLQEDRNSELSNARGIIDRQTRHLVRLVDELLDISRITHGKIHLEMERVEAAAVVAASVESSRPVIECPTGRCGFPATACGSRKCCRTCSITRRSTLLSRV